MHNLHNLVHSTFQSSANLDENISADVFVASHLNFA